VPEFVDQHGEQVESAVGGGIKVACRLASDCKVNSSASVGVLSTNQPQACTVSIKGDLVALDLPGDTIGQIADGDLGRIKHGSGGSGG